MADIAALQAAMPGLNGSVMQQAQQASALPASSPLEARCNMRGKVLVEYVFLGGTGSDLRSRTRVLDFKPATPEECPAWTFDGSQTEQAPTCASVLYLKPRAIYADPFRAGDHIIVLCDTLAPPAVADDGKITEPVPHASNNRAPAAAVLGAAASVDPTFSVEQQYMLIDPATQQPLGWSQKTAGQTASHAPNEQQRPASQNQPPSMPQAKSYCSVGNAHIAGRRFSEAHLQACLHAGLSISGAQAEAVPGQWSYTIGPCRGIDMGDQLWVSRFILHRLSEGFQLVASLDPKPVPGDWAGSGAPVQFCTRATMEPDKGWYAVQSHLRLLAAAHMQHMMVYGSGNDRRLTGCNKTSSAMQFSWGLENKAASVSIPHALLLQRRGGYEDRRPAANMDPYLVTMFLVCTTGGLPMPAPESRPEPSNSEALSADILDEMEAFESFAPDTPPQTSGSLASTDNSADSGDYNDCAASDARQRTGPQVHGGSHFSAGVGRRA